MNKVDAKGIEAVVFDLYDTLIYQAEYDPISNPFRRVIAASRYRYELARPIFMTEELPTLRSLAERFGVVDGIDFVQCQKDLDRMTENTLLYPETISVLQNLRDRGLKLGIISNLSSLYRRPFYDLGLDKYFDHKVFSCEAGFVKPQPEIYQIMIESLGAIAPNRILMTGDQYSKDVEAPRKAGMQAVHLDRFNPHDGVIGDLEGIYRFL